MMTTRQKVTSLLTMPLVFVSAFLIAFAVAGVADAFAQPVEEPTPTETDKPAYGYAPPSDDAEIDQKAAADAAHQGAADVHVDAGDEHHGGHHGGDKTEHWNWFGIHYGKDLAGGKFGDGKNFNPATGESVPGPEEPMSAAFIFMAINFALLMALLLKFGKPAVKKLAADRHDQIKTALDEAAKLRTQAQDKLAEYETKLKDADAEIKKLVEGIRADAEADKVRILANAEKQSAQMKKDAEQRIAAEIEIARAVLTREVTTAAAVATEKLLRAKMMPGDQQKLVSSFISDIKSERA